MRKSVVFIVLIVAGMTLNPGISDAKRITPEQAKTQCKGKASTGRGGCAWCGKHTCTMISCSENNICDKVTVKVRK